MSRLMLLVFLLIVLIITSQCEWKQQLVIDQDTKPSALEKQLRKSERQESVKEKILLSQEKHIQDLLNTVRDLREKLKLCRSSKGTSNATAYSSEDNNVIEIERINTLHD